MFPLLAGFGKIKGVVSLKKVPKIHFRTESSQIALKYAGMSALSIETISNPHDAAIGAPRLKMWAATQVEKLLF
jgi:hypothetical protein